MRVQRLEAVLFITCLVAFGYFHHGGGWNQNVRFAMARALVESGTPAVDAYLVYRPSPGSDGTRLTRVPVEDGRFVWEGRRLDLGWGPSRGDAAAASPDAWAVSGDLALHDGHFHPNKAPGVSFLVAPAYGVLHAIGRLTGSDPDDWWTLTLRAWLATLASVGVLSAAGCVVVYRLALRVSDGAVVPSLAAALSFAFGTIYFHYASSLYEHDVAATLSIAAFYFLIRAKDADRGALAWAVAAGACAGYSAVTNYVEIVVAAILGGYLLARVRAPRAWAAYGVGLAAPLALLAAYNVEAFGTPFTTNYAHQNPLFRDASAWMSVFHAPSPRVLAVVLFSPFRGLFYTSPVLLAGIAGLAVLLRGSRHRAEAVVSAAVIGFFVLFNVSFNAWAGGSGIGPRYLVPAIPFLAFPLALGFGRRPRLTAALAAVSAALVLLSAAVDPQCPQFVVKGRPDWRLDPIREYVWPLFARERPDTLLSAWRDGIVAAEERAAADAGLGPEARAAKLAALRRALDHAVAGRDPRAPLGTIRGPVSANPIGIVEGGFYALHPPESVPAIWNAFNAGEFLFPRSRWSLLPLGLFLGACALGMRAEVRRSGRSS